MGSAVLRQGPVLYITLLFGLFLLFLSNAAKETISGAEQPAS